MTRDPFEHMKNSNPVPPDMVPSAPMSMAERIVGARSGGWPAWALTAATAIAVLVVGLGSLWMFGGDGDDVADGDTTATTAVPSVTTTEVALQPVVVERSVYFFQDLDGPGWEDGPFLIPVAVGVELSEGADQAQTILEEVDRLTQQLLAGTAPFEESAQGLSSAIPVGTATNGFDVDIEGGVVAVHLNGEFVSGGGTFSMTGRLAQVVYTLTGIEGVNGVVFTVDGAPTTVFGGEGITISSPATRADFEGSLPAVFIQSPPYGGLAGNPLVATGSANVFEATVSLALTDADGLIIWEGFTTATCGTGCRGDWEISIPYDVDVPQAGSLIAWESSALDGSQTNVREHTVWLTPAGGTGVTTTTIPVDLDYAGVVYFLGDGVADTAQSGPYLLPVARPVDEPTPLEGTIQALLDGPSQDERSSVPAISSAIPAGTTLNSVSVAGGVAIVDLSAQFESGGGSFSMFGRLAQVVFTATRFDGVDGVRFLIDGVPLTVLGGEGIIVNDPMTREDFYPGVGNSWDAGPDTGLVPAVMIEAPAYMSFDTANPLVASGVANVFEATVSLALTNADGLIIWEGFTTATCGTGCWGEWDMVIPYDVDHPQMGALIAWESSAMDGSQINVREHPVWLLPAGDGGADTCSGSLVTDTLIEQDGLSAQDAAMRSRIFYAATGCDWEALRSLQIEGFRYSFGENTDAVAHWQQLEAAGEQPMRYLAELLNRPFGTQPSADPNLQYHVWPSAFTTEWSQVSDKEIDELRPLYDDDDFAGFADFGAYIGYRVGIIDGSWVYFVAGD